MILSASVSRIHSVHIRHRWGMRYIKTSMLAGVYWKYATISITYPIGPFFPSHKNVGTCLYINAATVAVWKNSPCYRYRDAFDQFAKLWSNVSNKRKSNLYKLEHAVIIVHKVNSAPSICSHDSKHSPAVVRCVVPPQIQKRFINGSVWSQL